LDTSPSSTSPTFTPVVMTNDVGAPGNACNSLRRWG
jgi:hypothetical protein